MTWSLGYLICYSHEIKIMLRISQCFSKPCITWFNPIVIKHVKFFFIITDKFCCDGALQAKHLQQLSRWFVSLDPGVQWGAVGHSHSQWTPFPTESDSTHLLLEQKETWWEEKGHFRISRLCHILLLAVVFGPQQHLLLWISCPWRALQTLQSDFQCLCQCYRIQQSHCHHSGHSDIR